MINSSSGLFALKLPKKKLFTLQSLFLVILISFFAFASSSCKKSLTETPLTDQSLLSSETLPSSITPYCKSQDYCLTAGQTINSGSVTISNDATNLYIKVNSIGGFQAATENIKIWLGDNLDLLPLSGGGAPIPGQFPFKYDASGNEFTATIPFSAIEAYTSSSITCSTSLFVYIHVDIIDPNGQSQTAWGGCTGVSIETPGRWYYHDTYKGECCTTPPPGEGSTQTAFAKGNINTTDSDHWVFTSDNKSNPNGLSKLNLTKNRWGWALHIKETGSSVYNIWAGAGLNNTNKGKLVGTLTVNWDGSQVTVTYNMNSGFSLSGIHVYAGDLKPTTIAPGKYGNIASFDPNVATYSDTYPVIDSNTDGIWLIAHAGVFGTF